MLAPLSSLQAYRRDAMGRYGDDHQDVLVASWLESATQLERAVRSRGAERDRLLSGLLAKQGVMRFPQSAISMEMLAESAMQLAQGIEDESYFHLAHNVLSSTLLLVPESEVVARGRVLAQQGRIARKLGRMDAARDLYERVEVLGKEEDSPELVARAWVGLGILAQYRGDYPTSRRLLSAVLELEGAAPETVSAAHTELMVAAAAASDFDAAAVHGWQAYQGARGPLEESQTLINLAQLMLVAGHARVALRGFAAVLARDPVHRHVLPALGGASMAAAAALPAPAARTLVRNFSAKVESVIEKLGRGAVLPYACASALVELSEAHFITEQEEEGTRIASIARTLAERHKFHELTHRLDHRPAAPQPVHFAPEAEEVVSAVEQLEGAELVGAA